MLRKIFVLLLALCTLSVHAKEHIIHLIDRGIKPEQGYSNSAAFRQLLHEVAETYTEADTVTLVLSPGVYEFAREGSARATYFISNHDHAGERAIGLHLKGLSHVRVQGMGATLLFLDRMLPIAIVDSHDVQISNLQIDFKHPQISHAEIVENRGEAGIVYRPFEQTQWRLTEEGEMEYYGRDWSNRPSTGIAFEGKTRRIVYRTADLTYSTKGTQRIGQGCLLSPQWQDAALRSGMVVAMRTYDRPNPAVFVAESRDTRLEGVAVRYADGMGLLAQNSHNVSLNRFDVAHSSQGAPRYATTQADATHFSACSGHIDVRGGLYEGMMDDAINVHGIYLKLTKRVDDYTVEGRYMHAQAYGMPWGRAGDAVRFVASATLDQLGRANELRSISAVDAPTVHGARVLRLRFAHRLPQAVSESTEIGIENLSKTPSVTFAGNTIRHNRARGILLNTPKPIRVEHNLFDHISGSAILASSDCNQWFESGQTRDLIIRGNVFVEVLTSVFQFTEAAIVFYPVVPQLDRQHKPFYGDGGSGITIEDNLFATFDAPLLFAQSVDGLLWRRNRVIQTQGYPTFHWNREPFVTRGSRGVEIQ